MSAGVVLSVVLSQLSATVADAAGIFVLFGESIGVGLLGSPDPAHRHPSARPLAEDRNARLALDNLNAKSPTRQTGWMTLAGTASTGMFAAVAALNCLITVKVGVVVTWPPWR